MFTSFVLALLSFAMLVYWFRYTCLLLLQARRTHDFAAPVIEQHGLTFRAARNKVDGAEIDCQLQRDFAILSTLLARVSPHYGFEVLLLRIDYGIMRQWWRLTYSRSPRLAGGAVAEMTAVLDNWATLVGLAQTNRS